MVDASDLSILCTVEPSRDDDWKGDDTVPLLAIGIPMNCNTWVALAFHGYGTFGIRPDGHYEQINNERWGSASVALQLEASHASCLHSCGIYNMHVRSGSYTRLSPAAWSQAVGAVRSPKNPNVMTVFHGQGVFRVDSCGKHTNVSNSGWSQTASVLYDPDSDDAIVFHDSGLYRVSLEDGSYTRVGRDKWSCCRCAVLDRKRNAVIAFHSFGIYCVSLSDGHCEKIASSQWDCAKAAVNINSEEALVFHDHGLYIVRVGDGSHSIVKGGGSWSCVSCVCPLGPMAWSASRAREG